jgi:hypothetical protein
MSRPSCSFRIHKARKPHGKGGYIVQRGFPFSRAGYTAAADAAARMAYYDERDTVLSLDCAGAQPIPLLSCPDSPHEPCHPSWSDVLEER